MSMSKKLLYVVTEDWYFLSHRLPMARAARDAGFAVHVACRLSSGGETIHRLASEGFTIHAIPFERGSLSPFAVGRTLWALIRLNWRLRPDIIHNVAISPCMISGLASLFSRPKAVVQAITGLGSIFLGHTPKQRILQKLVRGILRLVARRPTTQHIVQNEDDAAFLQQLGIAAAQVHIIAGSGVDSALFIPASPPLAPPIIITFVGRMLYDKGVPTLVEAFDMLLKSGVNARLILAGTPDPANIASLTQEMMNTYAARPHIEWRGHVKTIAALWQASHIAVLPSRREGFPKSLLEAAACGLPMVATDVPGCRALVKNGENGLLVPADDAPSLARALEVLCKDEALRTKFGAAARHAVENGLDDVSIGQQTVALYKKTLLIHSNNG